MNFFRQTNYKIEVPVPPPYEGLKKKYAKEISWENIKLNHNLNDRYIPPYVGLSYELIHEIENGESSTPASTSTSGQCDAPKTDANNVDNSATGSTPSNTGSSENPVSSGGSDVAVIPDGNSSASNTGVAVDGTSTPNENGSVPPVISATDGASDVSSPNGGNADSSATTTTPSTNGSAPTVSTSNDNSNVTPGTTDINNPGTSDTNTSSPSVNESEIPKSTETGPTEPGTEAVVPNEEKPITESATVETLPDEYVAPEVGGENIPSGSTGFLAPMGMKVELPD